MSKDIRFVVLEGIDGTGKTSTVNELCSWDRYVNLDPFDGNTAPHPTIDTARALIRTFKHLDKSKVYVLDRFLMSDVVYNHTLRGSETGNWSELMKDFCKEFDVLYVILDPDSNDCDYVDSKISLSRIDYTRIVEMYRYLHTTSGVTWMRRVVGSGVREMKKIVRLTEAIDFLMFKEDQLLQERYRTSPWRFFLCCIALNQVDGRRATRAMLQILHDFKDPWNMNSPAVIPKLVSSLAPLGLQRTKAKRMYQFSAELCLKPYLMNPTYLWSDAEIMDMPGLGKYARDSYDLLIRRNFDRDSYGEDLDKELNNYLWNKTQAQTEA